MTQMLFKIKWELKKNEEKKKKYNMTFALYCAMLDKHSTKN